MMLEENINIKEFFRGYVYLLTSLSGKQYVGQTKQKPSVRFNQHFQYALKETPKNKLATAIQKYPNKADWKFEILHQTDCKEELDRLEILEIAARNTIDEGYNIQLGGSNSNLNFRHSEESKRKMSESRKGVVLTEAHKHKMSVAQKGIPKHTEESKRKMSESRKGVVLTEAHKKKLSDAHKGIKLSADHRDKISKGKLGISKSDITKHNMSLSKIAKWKIILNDGSIITYTDKSLNEISEIYNYSFNRLMNQLHGKTKFKSTDNIIGIEKVN